MYIIFGLLSTLAVIILEFIMLQFNMPLHSVMPGLVLPFGGLIDGILCAAGLYLYLRIRHRQLKLKHIICGVIFSMVGFIFIYLMTYFTAYVDNGVINHSFIGTHISNYMYNENEGFTFINFLNFLFGNYITTAYSSTGMKLFEENLGAGFHRFAFVLEFIAFSFGGFAVSAIALESRSYCRKCKIDYIIRKLYSFPIKDFQKELEHLNSSMISKEALLEKMDEQKRGIEDIPYADVYLKYCPTCKASFIEFRFMYPEMKDGIIQWVENKDQYREIKVKKEFI